MPNDNHLAYFHDNIHMSQASIWETAKKVEDLRWGGGYFINGNY